MNGKSLITSMLFATNNFKNFYLDYKMEDNNEKKRIVALIDRFFYILNGIDPKTFSLDKNFNYKSRLGNFFIEISKRDNIALLQKYRRCREFLNLIISLNCRFFNFYFDENMDNFLTISKIKSKIKKFTSRA